MTALEQGQPAPADGGRHSADAPSRDQLAHMALDRLPTMVGYWSADQRCRFANAASLRWFGVDPRELIGRRISELLGPTLYARNLPYIERVLRGEPQEFEREIPDPAGGPPRHSLASYLPDLADGVRGFFVSITDISPIKRTELSLRESEERFRLTLDEAPIGMALVGTDGRFLRVNQVLCELLGYTEQELVGLTFQAVTHPSDLQLDLALAERLARGEIPRFTLEKRYMRKDGSIVHVSLSRSVLRGPSGEPVHFIFQVEDITERKRSEQEQELMADVGPVVDSNLDVDAIVDRVTELVTRRVADHCVLVTTDTGSTRTGPAATTEQGHAPSLAQLLLGGHVLPEVMRSREPMLLQRPSCEELVGTIRSELHQRLLAAMEITSVLAVPLLRGDRVLGALALVATRGSRAYDERDVRLATRLAWRTALGLDNARLYSESRKAIALRDEVLAIVAHDLRNPLSAIANQAALLRRRAQPRAGTEASASDTIQRAASRMARLIEDLLDVGRMEAGQLSVAPAVVPAKAVLLECAQSQLDLADQSRIALHVDVPRELPALWADRDRLLQVLENLIGNALKFTGPNGRVTLGAQARERDVLFIVRDTGAGIAPEHLPHLFDRFWQARRAERHGAGLGLPIAKGLVEAHGGTMWVESEPGQGATFYFTIARAPQPHPTAQTPEPDRP
ncbi:PAS domain S-box protein [Ramlibacter sp. AW1]|uniref:histidine kinase n=1 Tax=Ramlibacter aurantiacus TaxID=2801330 RepID=A0A937D382_9BURK|nr:PAS domain S-box protein [Ramlibacter aurantiacus]MBL0419047.1 PAS domain S-box protein [Ramlibacter aurantiacus]